MTSTGLIITLLPFVVLLPSVQATLWANNHNNSYLDLFFKWYTQLAEWPIIVAAILFGFFKHWKTGIAIGVCFALQALFVNGLKHLLNLPRPRMEVGIDALHAIPGVIINGYQSFPSGHTAAAFLGFGFISTLFPSKIFKFICVLLAAIVAYSRLYLGQHYLRDVLAGAAISLLILTVFDGVFVHLKNKRDHAK